MARVFSGEGSIDSTQADGQSDQSNDITLNPHDFGDSIPVPAAGFITNADMHQQGEDLIMQGADGSSVTVQGYFALETQPSLVSPDGKVLNPALVKSFITANNAEYAQDDSSMNDATPVGEVSEVKGSATVIHADGSKEAITKGSAIYEGDIIETAADGAVNVAFADESSFAVSNNARMAVDEFAFNSQTNEGENKFSVLRGLFVYTSGLVGREDPDDVHINTPVGSIGIRGTIIAGDIPSEGSEQQAKISVVEGAIVVKGTSGQEVTLSNQFETVEIDSRGGEMRNVGVVDAGTMAKNFNVLRTVAPTMFTSVDEAGQENGTDAAPNGDMQGTDASGEEAPANDAAPEGNTEQNAGENGANNNAPAAAEPAPAQDVVDMKPVGQAEIVMNNQPGQGMNAMGGNGMMGHGPSNGVLGGLGIGPAAGLAGGIANGIAADGPRPNALNFSNVGLVNTVVAPPSIIERVAETLNTGGATGGATGGNEAVATQTQSSLLIKPYYRADLGVGNEVDDGSFSVMMGSTAETHLDIQRFFNRPVDAANMQFEYKIFDGATDVTNLAGIHVANTNGDFSIKVDAGTYASSKELILSIKATTPNFYSPILNVELTVTDDTTATWNSSTGDVITLSNSTDDNIVASTGDGSDSISQNSSAGATKNIFYLGYGSDDVTVEYGHGEFYGEGDVDSFTYTGSTGTTTSGMVGFSGGDGDDLFINDNIATEQNIYMDGGAGNDSFLIDSVQAWTELKHAANDATALTAHGLTRIDGGSGFDALKFSHNAGIGDPTRELNINYMHSTLRNATDKYESVFRNIEMLDISANGSTVGYGDKIIMNIQDIFKISGSNSLFIKADSHDAVNVMYANGTPTGDHLQYVEDKTVDGHTYDVYETSMDGVTVTLYVSDGTALTNTNAV